MNAVSATAWLTEHSLLTERAREPRQAAGIRRRATRVGDDAARWLVTAPCPEGEMLSARGRPAP